MEKAGKNFVTPGFVPPSYSSGVHYGFQGAEVIKLTTTAAPAVTPTGSWIGVFPLTRVEVRIPGTAGDDVQREDRPPAQFAGLHLLAPGR